MYAANVVIAVVLGDSRAPPLVRYRSVRGGAV